MKRILSNITFPAFVSSSLRWVFLAGFLAFPGALLAQTACDEALQIASDEYAQGFFDRATFRLDTCLRQNVFNEEQEREAYLLLGKIYYANLQLDQAKDSVKKLLEKNPAYKIDPTEHKPGFIELYEEVMTEISAETQVGTTRSGFWIRLGLGPAEGNVNCNCPQGIFQRDDDPWNGGGSGGSFTLALGGTVNRHLQLGAELSQWGRQIDEAGSESTIGLLTFIATYYPNEQGNFFLKGGIGVGSSVLEREINVARDTIKLEAGGLGLQFGLGYDILLGQAKKLALTPYINISVLYAEEDIQVFQFLNGDRLDSVRLVGPENPSFFQLGLAFSIL